MFSIKHLILIPVFFFLAILQTSFLSHFAILGASLNLILISVFLSSFLELRQLPENFGLFAGFCGGLVLDIFSGNPVGTFVFTLGVMAFLIKKLGRLFQKSNILSFFLIFLLSFFFYKLTLPFFRIGINFLLGKGADFMLNFNFESIFSSLIYNLFFAFLFLLLIKKYRIIKQ